MQKYLRPRDIIASLDFRYYTKLRIESFIPESIKELKNAQQNNQPDRE